MGHGDEQICLLGKTTWLSRQAPQRSVYLAEFATLQDPNLNFVFSPKICTNDDLTHSTNACICSPKDKYEDVYSSSICNSPKQETFQISINNRMDK